MSTNHIAVDQPKLGETAAQHCLQARNVAARLSVAQSTLNTWLKENEARDPSSRFFRFPRLVGNRRGWSEDGYRNLERAIFAQSENGVLSIARSRARTVASPADSEAEASLAEILSPAQKRTF
jgi:hypothetical protein